MSAQWTTYYRPRTIEAIHLNAVQKSVKSLLAAPHFPHALLFAGPKGTGKTSVSRILAAILNDEKNATSVKEKLFPTNKKAIKSKPLVNADETNPAIAAIFAGDSYLVAELDAASNRGIDDIRRLKEQVAIAPIGGLVSVYILDEVHMLTTEAFNALLKMLEEPPPHAVFILATTELHKIPDTIVSRCQLIPFSKASPEEIGVALSQIVEKEKLTISAEDLTTIAAMADGSFRDAVKYLELQTTLEGRSLTEALHTPQDVFCWQLLDSIVAKDEPTVIKLLNQARAQDVHDVPFVKTLVRLLHHDLLANFGLTGSSPHFPEKVSLFLLQALSNPELMKPTPLPLLRLELLFLDLINRAKQHQSGGGDQDSSQEKTTKSNTKHSPQSPSRVLQSPQPITQHTQLQQDAIVGANIHSLVLHTIETPDIDAAVNESISPADNQRPGNGALLVEKWQELITRASEHNFSLAALLRSATPISGEDGVTTIKVYYSFHKDQLFQPKWFNLLQELITELAGGFVQLTCLVEEQPKADLIESRETASLERLAVDALM